MTHHTARAFVGVGAIAAVTALTLTGCGSGFSSGSPSSSSSSALTSSDKPLTIMIGSSGDAETKAVKDAVSTWSQRSGVSAKVVAATNLQQQLSQGFAAGSQPDLFYLSSDIMAGFADNGSLKPYGDLLKNKSDFYPALRSMFTYKGQFYCAPKDESTLQLVINTDLWKKAGLTDSDIPTTWDQLASDAKKLTSGKTKGLVFNGEYARLGVFMAQAGGRLVSADGKTAEANSAKNVAALDYVKKQLSAGTFAYAKDVGAGWGGEALGKGTAAMTVEGNWITGAMSADFPNSKYKVVQLPAGPAGRGTLQFSTCWGMAAKSPNQKAALDLVEYLTTADQQLAFSKAFGPMPSISSAAAQWKADNPALNAFLAGAAYAQGVPTNAGASDVINDFNSQLATLKTSSPAVILSSVQKNLEAVVKK
ncbi:MAG: extracellular solute-binding protein [Nocardiopsaceae bacterium]|jgi:multiple sugar transport system substrate-binding protein|nr:extracellular solute-binding protein [Nocardiopsaceae bacterium]